MFALQMQSLLCPVCALWSIRNDASDAENAIESALLPLFKLRFGHDSSKKLERISLDLGRAVFFPRFFQYPFCVVGDGLFFNPAPSLFVKKRQGVLQQVLRPGTTVHPSGRQIQAIRLSRDTFVFTESLVSVRISRLFYADFCQHALLNLSCFFKRL